MSAPRAKNKRALAERSFGAHNKQWSSIFNGDSTITSAVLDRLLHHGETVIIEGSSFRMKDRIET